MKKYMPFNGLRWSRDSGSALYDIPQTAVFGRAGGVIFVVFGINFAFRCPVGGATGHLVSIL